MKTYVVIFGLAVFFLLDFIIVPQLVSSPDYYLTFAGIIIILVQIAAGINFAVQLAKRSLK